MMLTEETPVRVTRRRIDWARLLWLMKSSPLTMIGGVIIFRCCYYMVEKLGERRVAYGDRTKAESDCLSE